MLPAYLAKFIRGLVVLFTCNYVGFLFHLINSTYIHTRVPAKKTKWNELTNTNNFRPDLV